MSRDPFRSSGDLGYGGRGGGGGGGTRWDTERFAMERDRDRLGGGRGDRYDDRVDDRDSRFTRGGGFGGRPRERSVDELYERRGPRGGYEDDRYDRPYYDDEPRMERERPFGRDRGNSTNITIEKEREYYSPSPPRRGPSGRPAFLRRQSSLDTFDRKPLTRFVEREEYGPPARYNREDLRPPPLTPIPLPRTRALPPPRRYAERDFEEIKVAEPDYYGDEDYRGYPERVREREIIRRRRRSRSRESRRSHSVRGSVRSSSISSSSSSGSRVTVRSEFPKKGKTRMPARLVSKQAIIDLGYPFEEEGDTIIIMRALGRENIDEVIKLSEDYKGDKNQVSGAKSEAGGSVYEEKHTHEVFTAPPPPPPAGWMPPPPPIQLPQQPVQIVQDTTTIVEKSGHHHHNDPVILDARPPHETTYVERSDPVTVGPLALALPNRPKDERSIRDEIRALEAEKEALRAERRADRELRKADRLRNGGRASHGDLVLYDSDRIERDEQVTIVRRERIEEPDGGVRIEKDRKGRMAISVPKYISRR